MTWLVNLGMVRNKPPSMDRYRATPHAVACRNNGPNGSGAGSPAGPASAAAPAAGAASATGGPPAACAAATRALAKANAAGWLA